MRGITALRPELYPRCRECGVEVVNDGDVPRERRTNEVHVCADLVAAPLGMPVEDAVSQAATVQQMPAYRSHRVLVVESTLHAGMHHVQARNEDNRIERVWFRREEG